jgi:hypothetical protein
VATPQHPGNQKRNTWRLLSIVEGGGLPGTLRKVIREVEAYFRNPDRP